jgi:hypothetical protein
MAALSWRYITSLTEAYNAKIALTPSKNTAKTGEYCPRLGRSLWLPYLGITLRV